METTLQNIHRELSLPSVFYLMKEFKRMELDCLILIVMLYANWKL